METMCIITIITSIASIIFSTCAICVTIRSWTNCIPPEPKVTIHEVKGVDPKIGAIITDEKGKPTDIIYEVRG